MRTIEINLQVQDQVFSVLSYQTSFYGFNDDISIECILLGRCEDKYLQAYAKCICCSAKSRSYFYGIIKAIIPLKFQGYHCTRVILNSLLSLLRQFHSSKLYAGISSQSAIDDLLSAHAIPFRFLNERDGSLNQVRQKELSDWAFFQKITQKYGWLWRFGFEESQWHIQLNKKCVFPVKRVVGVLFAEPWQIVKENDFALVHEIEKLGIETLSISLCSLNNSALYFRREESFERSLPAYGKYTLTDFDCGEHENCETVFQAMCEGMQAEGYELVFAMKNIHIALGDIIEITQTFDARYQGFFKVIGLKMAYCDTYLAAFQKMDISYVRVIPASFPFHRILNDNYNASTEVAHIVGDSQGNPILNALGQYRLRYKEGKESGWVPCVHPYAGEGGGLHFPFRGGTPVYVATIDNDIDRPVILGKVSSSPPSNTYQFYSHYHAGFSLRSNTGEMYYSKEHSVNLSQEKGEVSCVTSKNFLMEINQSQFYQVNLCRIKVKGSYVFQGMDFGVSFQSNKGVIRAGEDIHFLAKEGIEHGGDSAALSFEIDDFSQVSQEKVIYRAKRANMTIQGEEMSMESLLTNINAEDEMVLSCGKSQIRFSASGISFDSLVLLLA